MKTNSYDVVVIGASLGGVMSAVSACKYGLSVLLTEETDWIGGQLTSQAVPPDEHKYIEHTGCTASYREYRNKVRDYYRTHPYIIDELKNKEFFCPGGSSVSRLAHPPRLALKFLEEMVQPYIDNGCLTIMKNTVLTAVDSDSNEIRSVSVSCNNQFTTALAKVYIDGTDTGELVALSKTEYITGDEGIDAYSEPSASQRGDKRDMQPINWAVAVERNDKNVCDNIIPKPAEYDYFHSIKMPYDKYSVLSMYGPDSATSRAKQFGFYNEEIGTEGQKLFGLFGYRRIISSRYFKDNYEPYDVTLLNLPQNDFFMGNIFDDIQAEHNKYLSKQLTLSLLYYLQTEAPREGGKRGYGELALRKDILGTVDGLAKSPYVRESRRIKAKFTVTENDISRRYAPCAPHFWDSVGVGCYNIDLHITTVSHSFFYSEAYPFEIPLGALIPDKMTNLLPACKNIGTTHLTNGCYRLHPIEWNIGEVVGLLCVYAKRLNKLPFEIYIDKRETERFQDFLIDNGVQLRWNNIV